MWCNICGTTVRKGERERERERERKRERMKGERERERKSFSYSLLYSHLEAHHKLVPHRRCTYEGSFVCGFALRFHTFILCIPTGCKKRFHDKSDLYQHVKDVHDPLFYKKHLVEHLEEKLQKMKSQTVRPPNFYLK
jgi:hypothetical protein